MDNLGDTDLVGSQEMIHNGFMSLRAYLTEHKITQAEFGRMLDPPVSQGKVNHWLQGTRRVSLAEALQIVAITGGAVSMESLAALAAGVPEEVAATCGITMARAGEGAHA